MSQLKYKDFELYCNEAGETYKVRLSYHHGWEESDLMWSFDLSHFDDNSSSTYVSGGLLKNIVRLIEQEEAIVSIDTDQVWKHHSGDLYEVIAVANTTADKPGYVPTVCYHSLTTQEVYARSLEEFVQKMTLTN